jgi:putative Mn2+ efflux pump MntP
MRDLISIPRSPFRHTMDFLTPALIGIGLSMDCFAVSLVIGTTTKTRLMYAAVIIALCFGAFQAGMTVIGWGAGVSVIGLISAYDHWVAFILLVVVGGKMIVEGIWGDEEDVPREAIRLIPLLVLSVATSIDALAVGVSFGVLQTAVLVPALIIGIVCSVISFAGVMLGERLESVLGNKMEIFGGIILVLIGIRILFEHMTG